MTERENTSLPQKTLKESPFASSSAKATDDKKASVDEKVDAARKCLVAIEPYVVKFAHAGDDWIAPIKEALTALEDKIAELEKERALTEKWANGYFGGSGYEGFIRTLRLLHALPKEEAPTDGK